MRPRTAAVLLSLLAASVSFAGPRETINRNDASLCDSERRVCLRGTLSYYVNPRLLELRSRVQKAEGPGLLKFRLVGENADGHTRLTTLEVRIRGHYSEIVNSTLITDHPDVYSWRLDSISFEPEPPGASGNSRHPGALNAPVELRWRASPDSPDPAGE